MTFRIDYERGYMEFVMERFFPCIQADARKVFPMINRWCGLEQRKFLCEYLRDRAVDFLLDDDMARHKRALMNVKLLMKGGGLE